MKKLAILPLLLVVVLVMAATEKSFASDWDKAGKAFAITEGLRVVTGGRFDIIGAITGINRPHDRVVEREYVRVYEPAPYYGRRERHYRGYHKKIWVPHMVWREEYVPEHIEYKPGWGNIVVSAHYERRLVEEGGHWESVYHRY
jgi:hypothetical protein